MKIHGTHYFSALLLALLVSGCSARGPDYTAATFDDEKTWFTSPSAQKHMNANEAAETEWWNIFNDHELTNLIIKAASNNVEAKIAEANVREARALRKIAVASFYPTIDAEGSARRERINTNTAVINTGAEERNFYDAGFDASWELDLFGKKRRTLEAADARLESVVEAKRDILLSLLAEVARNYIELRGTQKRQAIVEKNIELWQMTVEIIRQRLTAGDANSLSLAEAEAHLNDMRTKLPPLAVSLRSNAYRLARLTGQEPEDLFSTLMNDTPLPAHLDIVPTGLRSDMLRRRPDIRRAERILASKMASQGAVTADLFPSFFITGAIGSQALHFGDLFKSGATAWAFGPLVQWSIFRGGEIKARIKVEEAQSEAAALRYEDTILAALEESENALIRYGEGLKSHESSKDFTMANEQYRALTQQRYDLGEDDILSLIESEKALENARESLVLSETLVLTNLVSLYKALGGGWEAFEEKK